MCSFCKQFTTFDVLMAFLDRRTRQVASSSSNLRRETEMWVIIQLSTAQFNVVTGKLHGFLTISSLFLSLSYSCEGRDG
jgi:hypothetical protein